MDIAAPRQEFEDDCREMANEIFNDALIFLEGVPKAQRERVLKILEGDLGNLGFYLDIWEAEQKKARP